MFHRNWYSTPLVDTSNSTINTQRGRDKTFSQRTALMFQDRPVQLEQYIDYRH